MATQIAPSPSLYAAPPSTARRRILDAARHLLRQPSSTAFSMEAAARIAGLSRRSMYNQFADRDALYRASRIELLEAVEEEAGIDLPASLSLRAALARYVETLLSVLSSREHRDLSMSLRREGRHNEWLQRTYERRIKRPARMTIEHFLLVQQRLGLVLPDDLQGFSKELLESIETAAAREGDRRDFGSVASKIVNHYLERLISGQNQALIRLMREGV